MKVDASFSSISLQRATSLPVEDSLLQLAAFMPNHFDFMAFRPCCGKLWTVKQFLGFILGISSLMACCVHRPMEYYEKANEMLGVVFLCAFFWLCEVIPVFATALLPLVLIPWLRITSATIIVDAYWNKTSMLFLGTFLVDVAVEHVGLQRRIALLLLLKVGGSRPCLLLGVLMGITWLFSMVCNSIATTMMICPLVVSLMNAAEESESASEEDNDPDEEEASEEVVPSGAKKVQAMADCLMLGTVFAAACGGFATLIGTPANLVLAGDPLIRGSIVTFSAWFMYAVPISACALVIAYIVLACRYTFRASVVLSASLLEDEYDRLVCELGTFSRDELLVGMVQLLLVAVLAFWPEFSKYLDVNSEGIDLMNNGCLAVASGLLLFFVPSSVNPGQAVLTWKDAQEKIQWGVLLLMGGGFALGAGFTESGLDMAIGSKLASQVSESNPQVCTLIICTITALLANVFSPVVTAAIVMPVFACAAMNATVHPLSVMLPATVACSFTFLLPTASQGNVVALAKSRDLYRPLRLRDFFANGCPILVGTMIVTTFLSVSLGQAVFKADRPYPEWACIENSAASCTWVYAPGEVMGEHVLSQACIFVDNANSTECRLWNGTHLSLRAVAIEGGEAAFLPEQSEPLPGEPEPLPVPAEPSPGEPAPEPRLEPLPEGPAPFLKPEPRPEQPEPRPEKPEPRPEEASPLLEPR